MYALPFMLSRNAVLSHMSVRHIHGVHILQLEFPTHVYDLVIATKTLDRFFLKFDRREFHRKLLCSSDLQPAIFIHIKSLVYMRPEMEFPYMS
jgi:hypothetical protein